MHVSQQMLQTRLELSCHMYRDGPPGFDHDSLLLCPCPSCRHEHGESPSHAPPSLFFFGLLHRLPFPRLVPGARKALADDLEDGDFSLF